MSLTPKKLRAIEGLLTQPTLTKAARHAAVATKTLERWLHDDDFAAELRRARARLFNRIVTRLAQSALHAVRVLVSIMTDLDVPPGVRVRAATAVLAHALAAHEGDISERLIEIERTLEGLSNEFSRAN